MDKKTKIHIVTIGDRILGGYSSGEVALAKAHEWANHKAIEELENYGIIPDAYTLVHEVPLNEDCFTLDHSDHYLAQGRASPCVGLCSVSTSWTIEAWKAHLAQPIVDQETVRDLFVILGIIKKAIDKPCPSRWPLNLRARVINSEIMDGLSWERASCDQVLANKSLPFDLRAKVEILKDKLTLAQESNEDMSLLVLMEQEIEGIRKWFKIMP